MNSPDAVIRPSRSLWLSGAALLACVLLGWLAYRLLLNSHLDSERHLAAQRLDAFALSLEATLARHESLPGLLALDPALAALLREPDNPRRQAAANAYLEAAQQGASVAVAFLIDARGNTLAASNWRLPRSFVGHNYAFRPYFRDALEGGLGRFYGIGVTTGEPGYFLAAPVRDQGRALGVIVLKVGLEGMEQALSGTGDTQLLTDSDGVVFLASERRWRYRALAPLPEAVKARLEETQQYGSQPVPLLADQPIGITGGEPRRIALPGGTPRERMIHARPVGSLGWQIVQFGDTGEARAVALGGGVAVAFAVAFLIGLAAHFRHRRQRREELRRFYAELEERIAERTADLTEQVAALERTKAILRETRDAAVQAGKLTTLGQMSAGISHELNQPLAALQTFADNASALLARGRTEEVAENLRMISDLVGRTGRIVRQLKTFARKEAATPQAVSVAPAIEHALLIVEPRRREIGAHIAVAAPPAGLCCLAEAGRLEQILVNLLRNGLDAVAGQAQPLLDVSVATEGSLVCIALHDHGPGLSDEARSHLFEAFYTTKPAGEGLGLGLAISLTIAESYGGTLSAYNAPEGGAVFALRLPAAGENHAASDA
ncbi:ATP-binding protein [Dechloromonas sp. CZR5]|uniref:sensor histidine kinase n=1 Tax=Dechloromonas sp. CZR5 TaxID=2608630 RepID=UPI001CC3CF82|nr:ATP-binding protein [Dechloromonas sp. CZR5]